MGSSSNDLFGFPVASPRFESTHWSVVLAAGRRSAPDSDAALESLCRAYWYPLYAFVRRQGCQTAEAQDLTQAFFARLLEKNYLGDACPERGRFRSFLLTACRNFLTKEWDKARAQKRGGGKVHLPLNFEWGESRYISLELSNVMTPEVLYERQWAITLLQRVMERLHQEMTDKGKPELFDRLKGFIVGQKTDTTYSVLASELGMTEAATKMAASRLRRRYRGLLRDEIAQTVDDPEEIDDEIRRLFATFSN